MERDAIVGSGSQSSCQPTDFDPSLYLFIKQALNKEKLETSELGSFIFVSYI